MKKRVCMVVIAAALLLTGCAGNPAFKILEQLAQSYSQSEKETASDEEESGTREASQEMQKDGDATKDQDKGNREEPSVEHGSKVNITAKDSGTDALKERGEADAQNEEMDSYVRGTLTDDSWESEYWNLRYTAPEGVFMVSQEGLDIVMGISQDKVSENYTEQQKKYLELTTLYEMMSTTATGDVNVVVTAEKLMVTGMATEDYKNAAAFQLRLLKDPVMEIIDDSKTVEIAGETYSVLNVIARQNGEETKQDYYTRVEGSRALGIIISYADEATDRAAEILNGFTAYEESPGED